MPSQERMTERESDAYGRIRRSILTDGESPSVRELQRACGWSSPRIALEVVNGLITKKYLRRDGWQLRLSTDIRDHRENARTVPVPLVGTVACGLPLLAQQNIEGLVRVSERLAPHGSRYFLLRAKGDSMDRAGIEDGDLLLVRQQESADVGQKVVALIDDEATVKILGQKAGVMALLPKSNNPVHRPMILHNEFRVQGAVVAVLPKQTL